MLDLTKLDKNLKTLQELHNEVESLIEGLPFQGPSKPDQSSIGYFSQAAHLIVNNENFIKTLDNHIKERVNLYHSLIKKVAEWDMKDEGLNEADKEMFRRSKARVKHLVRTWHSKKEKTKGGDASNVSIK